MTTFDSCYLFIILFEASLVQVDLSWIKSGQTLENLKLNLRGFIQPRLAWEVALLKVAIENL